MQYQPSILSVISGLQHSITVVQSHIHIVLSREWSHSRNFLESRFWPRVRAVESSWKIEVLWALYGTDGAILWTFR